MGDLTVFSGSRGSPFPKEAIEEEFDIVLSYLSQWIIPAGVLNKTRLWNINFHTGSPSYPGIGCTNFAIYNEERVFGVTAHIMEPRVDTGRILGVRRFEIEEKDSVYSLTQKCYKELFTLFQDIMEFVLYTNDLPIERERWVRKPYTRKELEELCRIDVNMSKAEIDRRIKATEYPDMPGAYIEIEGLKFEYNQDR